MTGIDAQLTREYFELNGFRVRTCWAQNQRNDAGVQISVENPHAETALEPELVLTNETLRSVDRALVEVRPWHTERLYASVIENNPVLTQFAGSDETHHAREFFGNQPFKTILVTSELPSNPDQRARAVVLLAASPIDHVIEFATVLRYLIGAVNVSSAYTASGTLQLIQLLKRYRLIQHQQMEFLFPMEALISTTVSHVETAPPRIEEGDKYEDDEWE